MGRRKIPIEERKAYIDRVNTFWKRGNGIVKKARELAVLCGTDVALIAFSPARRESAKPKYFFSRNLQQLLERYIQEISNMPKEELQGSKDIINWTDSAAGENGVDNQQGPHQPRREQQSVSHSGSQIPSANLLLGSQQQIESGQVYFPPSTNPSSSSTQEHVESRQVYWPPSTDSSSCSMQVPNFPPRIQGEEQLPQAGTEARIREPPPGEEQLRQPGTPSSMLSSIGSLDYMGSPLVISEILGLYGPLDYMGSPLVEWHEMFPFGGDVTPSSSNQAAINMPSLEGEEQLRQPGTPSSMLSLIGSLDYMGSPLVISEILGLYGPLDYMGIPLVEWHEMFPFGGDVTPSSSNQAAINIRGRGGFIL